MDREIVLLKIRNLLEDRKIIVINAEFEVIHRDGWTRDWAGASNEIGAEIKKLFEQLSGASAPGGGE